MKYPVMVEGQDHEQKKLKEFKSLAVAKKWVEDLAKEFDRAYYKWEESGMDQPFKYDGPLFEGCIIMIPVGDKLYMMEGMVWEEYNA